MSEPFTTEEQKSEILLAFQSITGNEDLEACSTVLERHKWNLENAVNEHFGYASSQSSSNQTQTSSRGSRTTPASSSTRSNQNQPGAFDWLFSLFWAPATLAFNLFNYFFSFSASFLPSFLSGRSIEIPFEREFEAAYGNLHPKLFAGNYQRLIEAGKRDLCFVLIYLHSPEHADTERFCREVLVNPEFINYVDSNFLFWGGNVVHQEPFRIFNSLDGTRFPFLAVVALIENRMSVVGRIQGVFTCERIIERLKQIVEVAEPSLVVARNERLERTANQRIREEQDAAYQESLRQDQEKQRLKAEAEAKQKREDELAAQRELDAQHELEAKKKAKQEKMEMLPEEPRSGGPGVTTIVVRLPDGGRLQRRFRNEDRVCQLYDFVHGKDIGIDDFTLLSSYPRRGIESSEMTLEKAGLSPNAMLFLQENEEDSDE